MNEYIKHVKKKDGLLNDISMPDTTDIYIVIIYTRRSSQHYMHNFVYQKLLDCWL